MHRLTRQILRPFLYGLLPLFLVACGSDDHDDNYSSMAYSSHSVVIAPTGTKSWGANGYGQLGNGSTSDSLSPVTVTGSFSAVSIGGAHSAGLDADGNVWTWGVNASGQLGNGTLDTKTSPVQVSVLGGIRAIAAGGKHTLAIDADEHVLAWGDNSKGQLGDGFFDSSSSPVQVSVLENVAAIAAGGEFSLALTGGEVWAWGNNADGQLGNKKTKSELDRSNTPVQVVDSGGSALSGITAIAAGGSHALALKSDGTVYAWGYNFFGQLGNGTTISSSVAVPIVRTGIVGEVTAISAGLGHSLAIIDGAVYAWGYNYYGQLGNGADLQSYTPVTSLQVVMDQDGNPLTNIESIIATGHHCLAIDTSGSIWTWGNNIFGQLGDGSSKSRSKAKKVIN